MAGVPGSLRNTVDNHTAAGSTVKLVVHTLASHGRESEARLPKPGNLTGECCRSEDKASASLTLP